MKPFPPTLSDAIYALGINGGWKIKDGKIAKWYSEKPQPTEEAIEAKLVELQADYDAKKYQRDRQPEYPQIGEQLDYIFHNGVNKWKEDIIQPVKDKYPKPE